MAVSFATVVSALVVIGCCLASHIATEPSTENAEQKNGAAIESMDGEFSEHDEASISFRSNSAAASAGSDKQLVVDIRIFNKTFTLMLSQNENLVHPKYSEKSITMDGQVTVHPKQNKVFDECYYTGKVDNDDQSVAAVSTCTGFNAEIMAEGELYHILPLDDTLGGRHRAYRQSNSTMPSVLCGVNNTASTIHKVQEFFVSRKKRAITWPQDLDGKTRMIELYVVIDYSQFVSQSSSQTAVAARTKQMVNFVSSLYQPQHIYVSLVGMEIWTTGSLITINQLDSSTTLKNFATYRVNNINPNTPNDNAHLITTGQYESNIIGLAYVGKMCTDSLSAAFDSEISAAVGVISTTMAHELGHNLGLLHDTSYPTSCACSDTTGVCIMYPSINGANLQTQWSKCSEDNLASFTSEFSGFCLNDFNGQLFDPTPVCGNGLVESGEQCDCGNAPVTECNPSCCNSLTCQLMSSSNCAAGRCCDVASCQLKPITTECRGASGSCDVAEYCSGVDNTCPSDVSRQDGTSCSVGGVAAYCYSGSCKSHGSQCQLWWGPGVQNSVTICYSNLNVRGQANRNCDYNADADNYTACSASDALCGSLHCDIAFSDFSQVKIPVQVVYTDRLNFNDGSSALCTGASFRDANPLVLPDPGYVPDGASCDTDKMCVDRHCVDVSSVLNQQPCPSCNQHGVCNSLGQCHCDVGYAPPDCLLPGNGGSYHSNPIEILPSTASLETTQPVTTTSLTTAAVSSAEATTTNVLSTTQEIVTSTEPTTTGTSPTTMTLAPTTVPVTTAIIPTTAVSTTSTEAAFTSSVPISTESSSTAASTAVPTTTDIATTPGRMTTTATEAAVTSTWTSESTSSTEFPSTKMEPASTTVPTTAAVATSAAVTTSAPTTEQNAAMTTTDEPATTARVRTTTVAVTTTTSVHTAATEAASTASTLQSTARTTTKRPRVIRPCGRKCRRRQRRLRIRRRLYKRIRFLRRRRRYVRRLRRRRIARRRRARSL